MKILYSILLILVASVGPTFSQPKLAKPIFKGLSLHWEIIENNYDSKPQSLTALTLATDSKLMLPAKGWKIYFNFAELIPPDSASGNVNITHINGDLFCISPAKNFAGIKASASLRIQFTSTAWVINYTDAPQGFYLVWDNAPDQCYAINRISVSPPTQPKQYLRSPQDKVGLTTPGITYEQNKNIRNIPADSLIKIFPTPNNYTETEGIFKLTTGVKILADPEFKSEAVWLKNDLSKLLVKPSDKNLRLINLVKKPMAAEAYNLVITGKDITIAASSAPGIFYGIQSLKTMLPAQAFHHPQKVINLKGIKVFDKPRFGYRAVMLDVARNFQSKKQILKLLDVMSLYKLNVLHFHLTDDEGWRLEIPGLPELTNIGAKRGHTLDSRYNLPPAVGSGPFVDNAYGTGFYTKADFIEILKYASTRHINVIPEIETPGHARAAIKAMDVRYQSLAKQGKPVQAKQYLLHNLADSSKYLSVQYYNDNVMDVSMPSAYNFIETITTELQKMYREANVQLKTIHYGGDEVPVGVWEKSPSVLSLMRSDTAIKTTDDLWPYYYKHVNNILKTHNLYLTAWEEVGTKKALQSGKKINVLNLDMANQNIHLEVWNNILGWGAEDLAYKLANQGYPVILSCVSNLYFDMAYNKSFDEPGYYWGGYADIGKSFQFIPFDYFKNSTHDRMGNTLSPSAFAGKEKLSDFGKANIVGLQGALWGETLKGPIRMEYMMLPKLLGLAERAWAKNPQWATEQDSLKSKEQYNEAWWQFINVLGKRELPRLDYYAGGFNYRIPNAGFIQTEAGVLANAQFPGFSIHYTLDGKTPTMSSPLYKTAIKNKGVIKLRVFNAQGRGGKTMVRTGN